MHSMLQRVGRKPWENQRNSASQLGSTTILRTLLLRARLGDVDPSHGQGSKGVPFQLRLQLRDDLLPELLPEPLVVEVALVDVMEVTPTPAIHAGRHCSVVGEHLLESGFNPLLLAQQALQVRKPMLRFHLGFPGETLLHLGQSGHTSPDRSRVSLSLHELPPFPTGRS
jgi:hypothetical protein